MIVLLLFNCAVLLYNILAANANQETAMMLGNILRQLEERDKRDKK